MKLQSKDFVFIFFIFIVCLVLIIINIFSKNSGDTVYIYYNSELYASLPLDENNQININNTNTVTVENGSVYMSNATCPDKLCMHQGKIHDSSKNIVCLPNKITVSVDKKSDIDAVSQ